MLGPPRDACTTYAVRLHKPTHLLYICKYAPSTKTSSFCRIKKCSPPSDAGSLSSQSCQSPSQPSLFMLVNTPLPIIT